jgi:hypothetical protein
MEFRPNGIERLAKQLIAAYDRGESCPPATEEALRDALPPNPRCPLSCPFRKGGSLGRWPEAATSPHSPNTASR